jgi:hypothetical protein
MKEFRESYRLFLVYMSFVAFMATMGTVVYFLFKLLPPG